MCARDTQIAVGKPLGFGCIELVSWRSVKMPVCIAKWSDRSNRAGIEICFSKRKISNVLWGWGGTAVLSWIHSASRQGRSYLNKSFGVGVEGRHKIRRGTYMLKEPRLPKHRHMSDKYTSLPSGLYQLVRLSIYMVTHGGSHDGCDPPTWDITGKTLKCVVMSNHSQLPVKWVPFTFTRECFAQTHILYFITNYLP